MMMMIIRLSTWCLLISCANAFCSLSSSVPKKILITTNNKKVITTTRTTPQTRTSLAAESSRTTKDLSIENWYRNQGIIGTSWITLCTSSASVGGRGLFWNYNECAQQGDILAFIPSKCLVTKSNFEQNHPEFKYMEHSDASWQAKLTTYAKYCLEYPQNDCEKRKEWIQSWYGGGPGAPRPSRDYSTDEIGNIARMADAREDSVKEAITYRYDTFMKDFKSVMKFHEDADENESFGDMYSIILSRTASLGPEWGNQRGIIPFHDMINHPPVHHLPNIELFCFGDLRKTIGYVPTFDTIRTLAEKEIGVSVSRDSYLELKDEDILLIAKREIRQNDEIWLSYKKLNEEMDSRKRIWLVLQYGFPFHK